MDYEKEYNRVCNEYIPRVTELEERIRFLEQCLDNKEKVNKQLREEIKELNKMMLFETGLEK